MITKNVQHTYVHTVRTYVYTLSLLHTYVRSMYLTFCAAGSNGSYRCGGFLFPMSDVI